MARRRRRSWVLGGLVLLAAVLSCGCGRQAAVPAGGPALAPYVGQALGAAAAPVAVEALLPIQNGCQDVLGLYLVAVSRAYPELVRLQILDMHSAAGRARLEAHRLRCAAVLVQGSTRFDLGDDGGKVLLEGPMDPLDVHRVLQRELGPLLPAGSALLAPAAGGAPTAEQRRQAGF